MELTDEEKKIQGEALQEIISRKDELIVKFVTSKKPLHLDVISFFMAGSPGAGKTEFAKRYMPAIIDKKDPKLIADLLKKGINIESVETLFIRIDVDEIRDFLSQCQKTDPEKNIKGNAHVIQKAANKGLDILRDYCFKEKISFLHDGTFGNFETMREMIKKSLKAGRVVQIFYIYIDPIIAWNFTKAREFLEGRNIVKDRFIEQFFSARENVIKIKKEFGEKVLIHCVLKDDENNVKNIELNVQDIDSFLKKSYDGQPFKQYTVEDLHNLISDV